MKLDLVLISGKFLQNKTLEKDQEYLKKYFISKLCRSFLIYYLYFGELLKGTSGKSNRFAKLFTQHTGIVCHAQTVFKLITKIRKIEDSLLEAQNNFDLEKVFKIKSGNF